MKVEKMNAKELKWQEGAPDKPGKYIFRHNIGLDLPPLELIYALHDPTAHKYRIVEVTKDEETGWLCWVDEDGVLRVANTLSTDSLSIDMNIHIWFTELPDYER